MTSSLLDWCTTFFVGSLRLYSGDPNTWPVWYSNDYICLIIECLYFRRPFKIWTKIQTAIIKSDIFASGFWTLIKIWIDPTSHESFTIFKPGTEKSGFSNFNKTYLCSRLIVSDARLMPFSRASFNIRRHWSEATKDGKCFSSKVFTTSAWKNWCKC